MTQFIEFYGLPASGKSTISHLLSNELRKRSKTVAEPTFYLDHTCSKSVRRIKKTVGFLKFVLRYVNKGRDLMNFLKSKGYTGSSKLHHAINISHKLWVYYHPKTDYVVFDEGLVQSAISITNDEKCTFENMMHLFNLCPQREVVKIYLKVDEELALCRMQNREKHDSRIEKIDDPIEKDNVTRMFAKKCNSIPFETVIDNKSMEESVEVILRYLIESSNEANINNCSDLIS